MEVLGGTLDSRSRRYTVAVCVSVAIHGIIAAVLLTAPLFGRKAVTPSDVIDVTLLDLPTLEVGAEMRPDSPQTDIEKAKPKPLTDPSEAELARMKKRSAERTPPERDNEFEMKRGFMPGGTGQTRGSMQLDAKHFPFMYYLSMMKNRISENWIPPFGSVKADETKKVIIRFRVDRGGRVLSPEVEESSGDTILDQSALRAVIVSGPFPPLPDSYSEASLGVHFGFICQL